MSETATYANTLAVAASAYDTTTALAEAVKEHCQHPVGMLQVAAILESSGITDKVAQNRYGYMDVFSLAEDIYQKRTVSETNLSEQKYQSPVLTRQEKLSDYSRGPVTLAGMLLLSIMIFSYQNFAGWQSTQMILLSIAILGSLLVTSGFVQSTSRKSISYFSQGYILTGSQVMVLIYRICTTVVLLIAVLSAIILLWKKWLTPADTTLLISAFLVFSCLWLVQAALFVVQKPYWFAITMVFSGSVTLLLLQGANWLSIPSDLSLIIGTIVGLCCVLIIAGIVIKKTFLQQAADSPVGRQAIALPSRSHLVATLTPYFLYGLLYTMLIISGHIPGWIDSVAEGKGITAVVFLEFSLTAALIGFILVGGIIENILRRFWYAVQRFQQQMSPTQLNLFTQSVTHFYQTERKRFLKGLIICNGIILVTALMLFYASLNTMLIPQAWHTEMVLMFILALFGYSLMAFGIFNSMFMLTLSQPQKANAAIFVSIIVTLIFGIIVGLFTPYYVSVAGILVGNLVFALISDRKLKTVWRDADYYYFASF